MATVLIADDERKVACLIQALIDWEGLGLRLVATAHNGLEALEAMRRHHPDIVITDIRMPDLDGLALIERGQRLCPATRFIVISGYRQFEYAHTALRFGVTDYILKPIEGEELNEALRRHIAALSSENSRRQEDERLRSEAGRSRGMLFTALAGSLLFGGLPPQDLQKLAFGEGCYRAAVLRFDVLDAKAASPRQDTLAGEWLAQKMEKLVEPFTTERLAGPLNPRTLGLLACCDEAHRDDLDIVLREMFLPLDNYLGGYGLYVPTLGISAEQRGWAGAGPALEGALRCAQQRALQGPGRVYREEALPAAPTRLDTGTLQRPLQQAVAAYDGAALVALVRSELNRYAALEGAVGSELYAACHEMARLFYGMLPPGQEAERQAERLRLEAAIDNGGGVGALAEVLASTLSDRLAAEKENAAAQVQRPVRDACAYIQREYAGSITLELVAGQVGLNPTYFSTLFKKETGQTFSDYLTEVRMEAAKALLRTTSSTVAAVGAAVGYRDSKYFSRTFTKLVGLKPAQYRRLYS